MSRHMRTGRLLIVLVLALSSASVPAAPASTDDGWLLSEIEFAADLDGDGVDELVTVEDPDQRDEWRYLTARKHGMPMWSMTVGEYARIESVPDNDGDGGREVLIQDRIGTRTSAFTVVEEYDTSVLMVSGATGRQRWRLAGRAIWVSAVVANVGAGWGWSAQPMGDATGDGIDDVLIAGFDPADPSIASVGETTICAVDAVSGKRARECIHFRADDWLGMMMPVSDVDGDGLTDVLVVAQVDGVWTIMMRRAGGQEIWTTPVDDSYRLRWPQPNFTSGEPGQIVFGTPCTILGCGQPATDTFDAATGTHLWHRDEGLAVAGDLNGDGHGDLYLLGDEHQITVTPISPETGDEMAPALAVQDPVEPGYEVTERGMEIIDADGDGARDIVAAWTFRRTYQDTIWHRRVVSGATRATLWEQRTATATGEAFVADVDGDGGADLQAQHWLGDQGPTRIAFRSGRTGLPLWSAEAPGILYREPVIAELDATHPGREVAVVWYRYSGLDVGDHIAGYGPAGRLWSVSTFTAGTRPDP